ncbi:hypothetical protein LTR87_009729 [Friedmanniomyces endolithicus]|nr:hypothetical protein LTR87_009729 [Friedmanniomyces endolithicus]
MVVVTSYTIAAVRCLRYRMVDKKINKSIFRIASETSTATVKATKTKDGTLPIEHYDHIRQVLAKCSSSYLKADAQTHAKLVIALDHEAYTKLMDDHDEEGAIVRRVVPAPLGIIGLRRVTGQTGTAHDQHHTTASNIPPFHCTVVELHPNPVEMEMYEVAHKAKSGEAEVNIVAATPLAKGIPPLCSHALPTPVEDPETTARENIDKRHRLQVATNNPALDMSYKKSVPAKAKDVRHCASATAEFIKILTLNCTCDQYILPTYAKAMIA